MGSPINPPFSQEEYWSADALLQEERRVFDICHGCRLCFDLCPSFPELFLQTDKVDGDLNKLTSQDLKATEDLCYQCKLCELRCPYTPPHDFMLDFPGLMQRAKAIRAKTAGITLSDRFMSDTDTMGSIVSPVAPLVNFFNRFSPVRLIMELVLGVHRKAKLPKFHKQNFVRWFQRRHGSVLRPHRDPIGKVAIFATCFVNYNDPKVGQVMARLLNHLGIEVMVPQQQCCGMAFLDFGDIKRAQDKMHLNLKHLHEAVSQGYDIVVPGPSCAYMVKREYPRLSDFSDEAQIVAEHTFELGQYLLRLHRQKLLNMEDARSAGSIAFHAACHSRAQYMGTPSADLLGLLPNTNVEVIERCSGHDGTWGTKKEYHELSLLIGGKLFNSINEIDPDITVVDCPLAAMQIEQATGRKPVHTVEVLSECVVPAVTTIEPKWKNSQ